MSKFLRNVDFDKFAEESNVQQIKKKGTNPTKKHNKDKSKRRKGFVDPSEIDW
jgi:hypothetical protein